MNRNIVFFSLLFFVSVSQKGYGSGEIDPYSQNNYDNSPVECFAEFPDYTIPEARSSRDGSAEDFYKNLNNWIPDGTPGEPLKNPPLMEIEISFHIFLDNNGGNSNYPNNATGKAKLMAIYNYVNQIYSNTGAASDPTPGFEELPGYDTRIRFTLGETGQERIFFYNNNAVNNPDDASYYLRFTDYIKNNCPDQDAIKKMNIFFTSASYNNSTKLTGYATGSLVTMCNCDLGTSDWVVAQVLAHELGHNLNLVHTYCGGGASVVGCTNGCGVGCIVDCNKKDYLYDIFGECPNSTVPHIMNWDADPTDPTIPNAEKITNNLMGGNGRARYLSPMQVGIMHRTLSVGSSAIINNVKKETYSPIPLKITRSEIWDFKLKLYRDIEVAAGAVLTLANVFDLPYNGTITVKNGAALVVEKTVRLSDHNKIIVQNGGTLKFISGSTVEVSGNGYIELQKDSYFCIQPNSTVKLNDVESLIKLRSGYRTGVNTSLTSLLPAGNCTANPISYATTGNGKILDYSADTYIQNETITNKRHIGGKNVYIGREVTTGKTQGDVILRSGSDVTVDSENGTYLEGGFEVQSGAEFTGE